MSKHHHHQCPREQDEIIDRLLRRCCPERRPERRPEALLPEELSPEEIRRLRCFFDCLYKCMCRPISNFDRVEAAELTQGRR
ncbi:MAG TPA: hypothetical protein VEF53_09380 [Patescibacteria group bacterium]|nr:hypothetical protein [Patescibacteria group bacterium]